MFERDDVVVDLDRAERLEKQAGAAAGAAVDDARDRGAVFGANDQHVAAVSIGHDLLLQVLRRVLAAQIGLERPAQPRALLAQPVPDPPQLAARIVHHLACGVDLAPDVRDLSFEGGDTIGDGAENREGCARAAYASCGRIHGRKKRGERHQLCGVEGPSFYSKPGKYLVEFRCSSKRDLVVSEKACGFRSRRQCPPHRAAIGQRRKRVQPRLAHGRLRVSGDDTNDAIEFERAQGTSVHLDEEGWTDCRQGNR